MDKNKRRGKLRRWPLGEELPFELLRLRDVQGWFGFSRDFIELLEKSGTIRPFRKDKRAKAWYRKWQLCSVSGVPSRKQNKEPPAQLLRRADVLTWLGVPAAEFESWVRLGIVTPIQEGAAKRHYSLSEIKENVLGLPK